MSGFLDRIVTRTLGTAPVVHRRRDPRFAAVASGRAEPPLGAGDESARKSAGDSSPAALRPAGSAALDAGFASAHGVTASDGSNGVDASVRADGRGDPRPGASDLATRERGDAARADAVGDDGVRDQSANTQRAQRASFARYGALDGEGTFADTFDPPHDARPKAGAFDRSAVRPGPSEDGSGFRSSRPPRSGLAVDARKRAEGDAAAPAAELIAATGDPPAASEQRLQTGRADLVAHRRTAREHIAALFDRVEADSNATEDSAPADRRSHERDARGDARETRASLGAHNERDGRDSGSDAGAAAGDELTINVSIGRIDVAHAAPPVAAAPSRPRPTLSEYMSVRAKVRGR